MDSLIDTVRKSSFYTIFRKWRERQQLTTFNKMLRMYLSSMTEEENYSEELIKSILSQKKSKRRPFHNSSDKVGIVVFGTNDWEQYGLWPSLARIADMYFFDYQKWIRQNDFKKPDEKMRLCLNRAFLQFVKDLDSHANVSCIIFYADTKFIRSDCLDALSEMGIWTIVIGLDDKHRFEERVSFGMLIGQSTIAKSADLMWTTWKAGTQIYLNMGACPWYAPEAADPSFYYPINIIKDLDVVFLGQSYGWRRELVNYLHKHGFQVSAYGPGWKNGYVEQSEMIRLFSRAKVVLGAGGVQSMSGVKHLKGRDFEVPMCSALYLTSYNYELADFFTIGSEILCYSSFEECAEALHWILRNPCKSEQIRKAAILRSLSEHTWEHRFHDLFNLFPR